MGLTLFDKIRRFSSGERRAGTDDTDIIVSVLDHLRKIMSLRQGGEVLDADLGIPDKADFSAGGPEFFRKFCEAVASTIEKTEPRLENVSVVPLSQSPDSRRLHFRIATRVKETGQALTLNCVADSDVGVSLKA